ncbi:hypothetical protein BDD12DRAFT_818834, partial [Trichophaea hybrida]
NFLIYNNNYLDSHFCSHIHTSTSIPGPSRSMEDFHTKAMLMSMTMVATSQLPWAGLYLTKCTTSQQG